MCSKGEATEGYMHRVFLEGKRKLTIVVGAGNGVVHTSRRVIYFLSFNGVWILFIPCHVQVLFLNSKHLRNE